MALRIAAICVKLNYQTDMETSLKMVCFPRRADTVLMGSVKGQDTTLNVCLMGVETSLKSHVALCHDLHVLPSNILLVFLISPA